MVGDNDAENEDGAFKMFNPTGEHRLSMDMNQLLKQTKSREASVCMMTMKRTMTMNNNPMAKS